MREIRPRRDRANEEKAKEINEIREEYNVPANLSTIKINPNGGARTMADGKQMYLCVLGGFAVFPLTKQELIDGYNKDYRALLAHLHEKLPQRFPAASYDMDEVWFARQAIEFDDNAPELDWYLLTHGYFTLRMGQGFSVEVPHSREWDYALKKKWYELDYYCWRATHNKGTYEMPCWDILDKDWQLQRKLKVVFARTPFEFDSEKILYILGNKEKVLIQRVPDEEPIVAEEDWELTEEEVEYALHLNKKKAFFNKLVNGAEPPADLTDGAKTLWRYLASNKATALLRVDAPRANVGMAPEAIIDACDELHLNGYYYSLIEDDGKTRAFFTDHIITKSEWDAFIEGIKKDYTPSTKPITAPKQEFKNSLSAYEIWHNHEPGTPYTEEEMKKLLED